MGITWILGVSKREIRDNGDIRRSEAERQRICLDEEMTEEDSKVSAGRKAAYIVQSGRRFLFCPHGQLPHCQTGGTDT